MKNFNVPSENEINYNPQVIFKTWSSQNSNRLMVIQDIYASQKRLKNFRITIQVKRQEPTKGEVQFIHDHLTSFRSLKVFTGEYGFIVPIKVAGGRRVLKGEKKLKYNMVSTSLI